MAVRKVGQSPAWSVATPPEIAVTLQGQSLEFYRRGVLCMSQGFGLGAVAYFRRVVEDATNTILGLVEEAARLEGNTAALAAIAEAKTSRRADEKLKQIADALPPSLRVGGHNPLSILHDAYSRGVHAEADSECEAIALRFRASLDFALGGIARSAPAHEGVS